MAGGKIDIYKLGTGGVNLVKSPLHLADEEVLRAQNAEVVYDVERGGEATLSKRGGYPYLNESALSGSIVGMAEVRFLDSVAGDAQLAVPVLELSRVESSATITPVNAADEVAATSDLSDSTYMQMECNGGGASASITFRLTNPLTDPGVYTGWKIKFTAQVLNGAAVYNVRLRRGATSVISFNEGNFTITGSFVEYELDIDSTSASTFASGGGLTDPRIQVTLTGSGGPNEQLNVSRIELFIPGA